MAKMQFRVLYRQFLFRMVDLEILSPDGDVKRILGQFAALLIWTSLLPMLGGFMMDRRRMSFEEFTAAGWSAAHFFLATTMLAVGLFALLSWDSAFPDRRDVLVLGPLPVRPRTLFLAKVAALIVALSLTVATFNGLPSLSWAVFDLAPPGSGITGTLRCFAVYWIALFAAGAFVLCMLLGIQGLAGQLPRRLFLRISPALQMGTFAALFWNYFLEPRAANPLLLSTAQSRGLLDWWPSYWFMGLFEAMNGWPAAAVGLLARRACAGLALAACAAATMFLLSYLRTIRKIVEEADIVPGARGGVWLPPFGNALHTAVVQFAIRSLLRSRQHRVILGFYMGIGFALVTLFVRSDIRGTPELGTAGMMALSLLILCFAVTVVRFVITMPADLRANWIFRITAISQPAEYARATRRSVLVLATAPVWLISAGVFFALCPWRVAAGHTVVLIVLGVALVDASLIGFRKIPFTCSYLPGKSQFHLIFLAGLGLLFSSFWAAQQEMQAMRSASGYAIVLSVLAAAAWVAHWRFAVSARADEARVQFDDSMTPAVQTLGLTRDGIVSMR